MQRLMPVSPIVRRSPLAAAIMEGLRLYPSVPVVPRECSKDTVVNGYQIHKGVRAMERGRKVG